MAFSVSSLPVDQTLNDNGSRIKAWFSRGRLEPFVQHCVGACHPAVEGRTTHPLGEEWALDAARRYQIGLHIDHVDPHVPHAAEAILGCEPTELYLQRRIDCESYYATAIQLNFDLLLPGANL